MKHLILGFVLGASFGSALTYFFLRGKFEERSDQEIEAATKYFMEKERTFKTTEKDREEKARLAKAMDELDEIIEKEQYSTMPETKNKKEGPYPITPEQYVNECQDFDKIDIYYYEDDDVLCDEDMEIIDHREWLIGEDGLSHFDEHETDACYIRNESLGGDYAIIKKHANYHQEVLGDFS